MDQSSVQQNPRAGELKTVLWLARTVGSDKAAAWADRWLKREKKILDAITLRLLRLPWPPGQSAK